MEGPQSKGQIAVGEKLGAGGAHFRGREVRAGFTEERLLKLRPWGQKTPAKQTLGGNVPGPQRARGEKWHGMFEGTRSQGDGLDEARRESLGKGLAEEAEAGHLGPRGLRGAFALHCSTVRSPGQSSHSV